MRKRKFRLFFPVFTFLLIFSFFARSLTLDVYALPALSASLLQQDPISKYASSTGPNYLAIDPEKNFIVLCTNATRTLDGWRPSSEYPDVGAWEPAGQRYYLDPKGGTYDIYKFMEVGGKLVLQTTLPSYAYGCLAFEGISVGAVTPPPTPASHLLTIRCVYQDGTAAAPPQTYTVETGKPYSYTSPSVRGNSPNISTVSGTMPDADRTVTVTYTPRPYTLTIKYVYANGDTASPTQTYTVPFGQRYSHPSPVIPGFTPDTAVVAGEMDAGNFTWTVVYSTTSYLLTIHYVYPDGSTAVGSRTYRVQQGTRYSYPSPVVRGYAADRDPVSGTMPANDLIVTVRYAPKDFKLTIHYRFEDGTEAAPDQTHTVTYGEGYNYPSPPVTGFVPNPAAVTGLMLDQDQTVIVTYSPRKFSLTINYLLPNGDTALPSNVYQLAGGKPYAYPSPGKAGYLPDIVVVTGTMPHGEKVVNVIYYPGRQTLTVRYVYADGSRAAPSVSVTYATDQPYSIPSPAIHGFTPDRAVVSGTMSAHNETVTVTYRPEGSGGDGGSSSSGGSSSGGDGGGSSSGGSSSGGDGGGSSSGGSGSGGDGGGSSSGGSGSGGDGGGDSSGGGNDGFGGDGGGIHRPGEDPDVSIPPGGYIPDGMEDDFHIQGPVLPDLSDFDWNFWDPDKHKDGALEFNDTKPLPEVTLPGVPDVVAGDPGEADDPLDPDQYGFTESKKDFYYYLSLFGIHVDR